MPGRTCDRLDHQTAHQWHITGSVVGQRRRTILLAARILWHTQEQQLLLSPAQTLSGSTTALFSSGALLFVCAACQSTVMQGVGAPTGFHYVPARRCKSGRTGYAPTNIVYSSTPLLNTAPHIARQPLPKQAPLHRLDPSRNQHVAAALLSCPMQVVSRSLSKCPAPSLPCTFPGAASQCCVDHLALDGAERVP